MNDEYHTKVMIWGIIFTIMVGVVLALTIDASLDSTKVDRAWRIERARACETVSDQALRTLCLVKAP